MKNIALKVISVVAATILLVIGASAQKTFLLKDASKRFDIRVQVAECSESSCEGKATIELLNKSTTAVFQKIEMPEFFLELGDDLTPTTNVVELYGDNSGIVFGDFNFDGKDDLALRNGNYGLYGGPSYDVLLYSASGRKFVLHEKLTELASNNLGLFDVDPMARTITTFAKSGCCWHQTERYVIRKNQPVKVYELTEDATVPNDKVRVTTRRLVNGRWRKSTKIYSRSKYYKE